MSQKTLWAASLVVAFGIGWFSLWLTVPKTHNISQPCFKENPFISREIDCATIDSTADQIKGLQKKTAAILDEEKAAGNIDQASVFFRDLNSRRWFGINDNVSMYPASLIKLPLAITYYKVAELDPSVLDQELTIPLEDANDNQSYHPPQNPLAPGNSYPVRELVRHMLQYSDNAPFTPLMDASRIFHDKILFDLGIYQPATDKRQEVWTVSTKSYANIFRTLYNASYLNLQYSNKILDTLSKSTFDRGIVAGVPKDVLVAHKFGEGSGVTGDGQVKTVILNDCGIVYKKDAPYILCIMTEGKSFESLEKTLKRIAETSYEAL